MGLILGPNLLANKGCSRHGCRRHVANFGSKKAPKSEVDIPLARIKPCSLLLEAGR